MSSFHDEQSKELELDGNSKKQGKKGRSFKEMQQERKKKRNEQRKAKQKCRLCGKPGHIRKECPGIEDGGRGQSKYKSKNSGKKASKRGERGAWRHENKDTVEMIENWPMFNSPLFDANVDVEYDCTNTFFDQLEQQEKKEGTWETHLKQKLVESLSPNVSNLVGWLSVCYLHRTIYKKIHKHEDASEITPELLENIPSPFVIAASSVPKDYSLFNDRRKQMLVNALKLPYVVGIRTGLDYGVDKSKTGMTLNTDKYQQLEVFKEHLQLSVDEKVTVMISTSPELRYEQSKVVEEELVEAMIEILPPDHPVHLCSFGGHPETIVKLRKHFSNMYVGISGIITFRDAKHLKEIVFDTPLDRLVLESNTPKNTPNFKAVLEELRDVVKVSELDVLFREPLQTYHDSVPKPQNNSPALLPFVAYFIAKEKQLSVEEVLEKNVENIQTLYGIPENSIRSLDVKETVVEQTGNEEIESAVIDQRNTVAEVE